MATDKFKNAARVSYKEKRGEIQAGDILFCSGNYTMSKMIQTFSGSMFSHVAFVFPWNDRVLVLESVEDDGVRAVPLSHYLYNYENSGKGYDGKLYIGRVNAVIDEAKVRAMLGQAADLLNRKYDKDEIARIAMRVAIGMFRHNDDDEYICSEFVDTCFKKIDIIFQRDSKGFIFPEHIAADQKVSALCEIAP